MSFFKRLFGGGTSEEAGPSGKAEKTIEYNGFTISAMPYKAEGGQYQTCGMVSKEIDGEMKEHKFIRADRFASLNDAVDVSLSKGRQLVDQLGDRVFGQ